MGTDMNCSRDHYLEKSLLHSFLLSCGERALVLPNHSVSKENLEPSIVLSAIFSDIRNDGNNYNLNKTLVGNTERKP